MMTSTTEDMTPIRINSGFMYGYSAVAASVALLAGLTTAADAIEGAAAAGLGAIAAASSSS